MAITLDFFGGLFLLEETDSRIVEVHFWRPQPVRVLVDGLPDHGLSRLLSVSAELDLEGSPLAAIDEVPIRHLSETLPLDYQSTARRIRFTAGELEGDGPPVTESALLLFQQAKSATNGDDALEAFRKLSGISGRSDTRLQALAEEFFAQDEEELKYWQLGYRIKVAFSDLHARAGGPSGSSYPLPDDARIVFDAEETSSIPHLPLGNPHVLERPPTRRRKKKR